MRIISHRGNLNGPQPERENSPIYIMTALDAGFDVEIDLWLVDNLWMLGHDEPQHLISPLWLTSRVGCLWVHCKHATALHALIKERSPLNYFWHQHDAYTLTSHGFIWALPGSEMTDRAVVVDLAALNNHEGAYGVCTDYPYLIHS